jgi:hypothetical protein
MQEHTCLHDVSDQGDFFEHALHIYSLPLDTPSNAPKTILEFDFDDDGAFVGAYVHDADNWEEGEALYSELEEGQSRLDEEANPVPVAKA